MKILEDIKYLILFLIGFVEFFLFLKIIIALRKKQIIKEKNMIDNGIKISSLKNNLITLTFSNGRKNVSLAVPYPESNFAILDSFSRYVGADRIDGIGENLDVNFTVTRGKSEIDGCCEQFVMIINNSQLKEFLNENGVSSFSLLPGEE